MKNLIYVCAACSMLIMSCKKNSTDNATPDQQIVANNKYMYPLAVGNYWVYGEFSIDSLGNEIQNGTTDSVYIEKDTTINGYSYYKMYYKDLYTMGQFFYYRDSAGYRVSLNGIIDPLIGSIGDTLANDTSTYYSRYTLVCSPPASVTVQSQTFSDLYSTRSDSYLNAPFNTTFNPLQDFKVNGNNIGLLYYQYHFSSMPWMKYERRLIRFHLN